MTVTEYAKKYNVSKQSVYDKLNRGTLEFKVIKGIKHIILNDGIEIKKKKTCKKSLNKIKALKKDNELLKLSVNSLEKLLKSRDKEIVTLEKTLSVFTSLIDNKLLASPQKIEDISIKKSKKKK